MNAVLVAWMWGGICLFVTLALRCATQRDWLGVALFVAGSLGVYAIPVWLGGAA